MKDEQEILTEKLLKLADIVIANTALLLEVCRTIDLEHLDSQTKAKMKKASAELGKALQEL